MDMRNLPDALFEIMKRHGWSQYDLAREFGVPQSWVWRAASGTTDPGIARTARLLKRVGWEVRVSPKMEDDDPVKRREFVAAAASVTFVPSPRGNPYQDPVFVKSLAEHLEQNRNASGGVPFVATAMRQLKRVESALHDRDRRLQAAASTLARRTALLLYDARRIPAARHVGEFALALGRRAGDVEAQCRACAALSQISVYAGDGVRSARYAETGLRLPDLSQEQRAVLSMRLGRAYAITDGAARNSRAALDQALEADCSNRIDAIDMVANFGFACRDLGLYEAADAALAESADMSSHLPHFQTQSLAGQVQVALRAGDPSRAADRMTALARAAPLVTSSRLDVAIADILALSARWAGVPEIREARDALGHQGSKR